MISNRTYIGEWHYGKTHMIDDGSSYTRKQKPKVGLGKQVPAPEENWIAVKVPAIIDPRMFEEAQKRLGENQHKMVGPALKHEHLLTKRIRCAKCGYVMRIKTITQDDIKYRYYQCSGHNQNPPIC